MLRDFIVIIAVIIMEVIIMTIIPRRELDEALREYKWLLIYGRRKTGKTFYVREVASYDRFFIVTRSREVLDIDTGERYSHREFERMIPLLLKEYRVVVDEFHRLGESFASVLQALSGVGRVILITSTMHFFRRVIGSPLIGLFNLRRVGLVDPRDAIIYVKRLGFEGRDLMELACIVREPWLAPMLEKYGIDIISKVGDELRVYIPHLIGETFIEEDIAYVARYSAILGAIADGYNRSSEISNLLFSKGVIGKDNPGLISQYLKNIVQMGLVKATPIEGARRKIFYYRHVSPITDFAYYLNEKYGFFETGMNGREIATIFKKRISFYMEWFFEDLLAKVFGLQPVEIVTPDIEVDIALREFRRVKVVAEVKWREHLKQSELRSIEKKLNKFDALRILIVPYRGILKSTPKNVEVWDWKTIVNIAEKYSEFREALVEDNRL